MSAETLRRVAALMRERAEAATPGPWDSQGANVWCPHHMVGQTASDYSTPVAKADATHIASWHPAVSLAVASMIHEVSCGHYPMRAAEHLDPYGCATCYPGDSGWPCDIYDEALAVANAYLGEPA